MLQHDWIKSPLGHGDLMCANCLITIREAAVLNRLHECDGPNNTELADHVVSQKID